MDKDYLKGIIEEVLYIWGEAIDLDELSKLLYDFDKKEIEEALLEMIEERKDRKSGLIIKKFDNSYQFTTGPASQKYLEKYLKPNEKKLSSSSLETLSIIAYKQPITRAEVDKIRGISSQKAIDSLREKGLVEEKGRLEKIGKPIIYGTSKKFLAYFDLESLEQLPKLPDNKEDALED